MKNSNAAPQKVWEVPRSNEDRNLLSEALDKAWEFVHGTDEEIKDAIQGQLEETLKEASVIEVERALYIVKSLGRQTLSGASFVGWLAHAQNALDKHKWKNSKLAA